MMRAGVMVSLLLAAGMLFVAPEAQALRNPRGLATDNRIKTVMYDPNQIYKFTGHYGYESSIEFATDEEVQTVSVGDSVAWQVTPNGSRLFLKPVEQDALTNMTVVTNKRTYHFELHPAETEDISDPAMTFVLRFMYPSEGELSGGGVLDPVPDPTLDDTPGKYKFNYTISGANTIAALKIFDDGEFTYFQFRDKNGEIPGFFQVGPGGEESLVNFRVRGSYVVVERVASQFTLRHGKEVVCVFNEAMPKGSGARRALTPPRP